MRILFVTPYYIPELKFGGPPRKIHSMARGLAAIGHSVTVLTFASETPRSSARRWLDGVAVRDLRWIGSGLRQCPIELRVVRSAIEDADVLQCFGIYNLLSPLSAFLARRRRIPFVVEPLGMYPPRAGSLVAKRLYNATLTRWMVRNSAAIVAASHAEAAELTSVASPSKIVYRRNGIDVSAFAKLSPGHALRTKWGIGLSESIVLYVGRLSPIKNLEQVISAFGRLNVKGNKVGKLRLVLVGPSGPEYEKRLRAVAVRAGVAERVVFAGPLYDDEQRAALASADLFVLPSLNESFGNAAAEAVAAGVPVLLTKTCGIAPLIHARAGLAVPLGIDSLAEGLRKMLDPEFRDRMTAKREEVIRELSWDEPIRHTEELYERLISESKNSKVESRTV